VRAVMLAPIAEWYAAEGAKLRWDAALDRFAR
jgi:hypothetical protein